MNSKTNQSFFFISSILIIILGIYLIGDGLISIYVQIDETWDYQFWRIIRSILGCILILIGIKFITFNHKKQKKINHKKRKNK